MRNADLLFRGVQATGLLVFRSEHLINLAGDDLDANLIIVQPTIHQRFDRWTDRLIEIVQVPAYYSCRYRSVEQVMDGELDSAPLYHPGHPLQGSDGVLCGDIRSLLLALYEQTPDIYAHFVDRLSSNDPMESIRAAIDIVAMRPVVGSSPHTGRRIASLVRSEHGLEIVTGREKKKRKRRRRR